VPAISCTGSGCGFPSPELAQVRCGERYGNCPESAEQENKSHTERAGCTRSAKDRADDDEDDKEAAVPCSSPAYAAKKSGKDVMATIATPVI